MRHVACRLACDGFRLPGGRHDAIEGERRQRRPRFHARSPRRAAPRRRISWKRCSGAFRPRTSATTRARPSPTSPRTPTSTYARRDGTGSPDLRLVDVEIERGERRREVTIIEVVNDNMPFLLDSTLAEILDQGYEPKLVAHPILALERNAAGALSRFYGEATGHDPGQAKRESFIHIHLDRIDDEAARLRLTEGLQKVYGDVAVAVRDWAAMRDAIVAAIREYAAQPPPLPRDDVREAIAFLEWLADNNFTFLGVREYRFPEEDTAADPIQESGLGLLRDPTVSVLRRGRELVVMTPELRAFLGRPQALIVTKANVKSRVHRRVHLDYIGIKLFLPNGRLRGELRLVGLFTSDAYTSTPGVGALSPPQGGEGDRQSRLRPEQPFRPRAAQRARHLSARRAVPDRRGHALPLRRRDHEPVGAAAHPRPRPHRSVRSLRVRPRLHPQGPLRFRRPPPRRRVPGGHLPRPPVGRLPGLSGRAPRPNPLHHRPRRRRDAGYRARRPGRRHRRDRAHLERPPRRGARRRGRGPRARARSRRATATPSTPPIAKPSTPSTPSPTSRRSRACPTRGRAPSTSTGARAIRKRAST